MSTYVFKAMDLAGVKARGELEADSKQAVSDQLKQRGLIVLEIADKHASREIVLPGSKRVNASELAVFSRQLATMISSGMSILRALYVLEWQTENKFLKETIVAVRKDVEAGLSLSDSLARHPKVFNPLFVAMAQAGEAGGVLEDALLRVADQLEKDASLRRQIRSAMVYPALVIFFAVGVMMALVAFLVPVFEGVFKQFGGELPSITKVSVFLSHAVTGYWWLIFVLAGGSAFAFLKWKKSSWGRPQWDHFRLRIPMKIGTIVQQVAVARWSRTLSSLTSAGVPLLLGARHHGSHGRQRGGRGGDGGRDRLGQARRHDRGAAGAGADLPGDGHAHGRRGRGNGRAGHDAQQGRRVLRGPGGSVGQGAHVDPRADHDHRDRRHRRLHRDLDVPAAVHGLQQHQIRLRRRERRLRGESPRSCERRRAQVRSVGSIRNARPSTDNATSPSSSASSSPPASSRRQPRSVRTSASSRVRRAATIACRSARAASSS